MNKVHHHAHTSTSAILAMSRIQSTLFHSIPSSRCFSNCGWRTTGGTRHSSSRKTPLSAGGMGCVTVCLYKSHYRQAQNRKTSHKNLIMQLTLLLIRNVPGILNDVRCHGPHTFLWCFNSDSRTFFVITRTDTQTRRQDTYFANLDVTLKERCSYRS